MQIISSAQSTILSDFAKLTVKCSYDHPYNGVNDFQICRGGRKFIEFNKKSGVHVMALKESNTKELKIHRVSKLPIENVSSIACTKVDKETAVLGMSDGEVKFFNFEAGECTHRFMSLNNKRTVDFLDCDFSDKYLSATFGSGHITVFDMNTSSRIDTVRFDGCSILSRFHPTKRMHLAVASYKGAVTMYDIPGGQNAAHWSYAHSAPCRDLCMSAPAPDTLISVGFDCALNIFDMRRKAASIHLSHDYPLSSVSFSDCAKYICAGDLNGRLITYDIRNTKSCLFAKKIHETAVTRVAFVPDRNKCASNNLSKSGNTSGHAGVNHSFNRHNENAPCESFGKANKYSLNDLSKSGNTSSYVKANHSEGRYNGDTQLELSTKSRVNRDSVCVFVDAQVDREKRGDEHNVSKDWEKSISRKNPVNEKTPKSKNCDWNSKTNSFTGRWSSDCEENKENVLEHVTPLVKHNCHGQTPCKSQQLAPIPEQLPLLKQGKESCDGDKENTPIPEEFDKHLPADRNSTPKYYCCATNGSSEGAETVETGAADVITFVTASADNIAGTALNSAASVACGELVTPSITLPADLEEKLIEMRDDIWKYVKSAQAELEDYVESIKEQIFVKISDLCEKDRKTKEKIYTLLNFLLKADPTMENIIRLNAENQELGKFLKDSKE